MTTTKDETLQEVIEKADPNNLADALRKVGVAYGHPVIKAVATGLTSAAAFDITSAAFKAAATITGITLETGENLPPIGNIVSLRPTAVITTTPRIITDSGDTPAQIGTSAVYTASVSDDGKTVTFEAATTAFIIVYQPRSKTDLATKFAPSS